MDYPQETIDTLRNIIAEQADTIRYNADEIKSLREIIAIDSRLQRMLHEKIAAYKEREAK